MSHGVSTVVWNMFMLVCCVIRAFMFCQMVISGVEEEVDEEVPGAEEGLWGTREVRTIRPLE
jgi:hypothetical protein